MENNGKDNKLNQNFKRLNIGAGTDIKEGWINHDFKELPQIDVVHNLEVYPWPWKDRSIDEIYMKDVLEHLSDTTKAIEELHRICKPGAKIFIGVPYWNSFEAITDPTHKAQFNEFTFDFFDPTSSRCQSRPYYTKARFKIVKIGFVVSFFGPYIRMRYISHYFRVFNPIAKWIIGLLASIFNNVITGLDIYLEKK